MNEKKEKKRQLPSLFLPQIRTLYFNLQKIFELPVFNL